MIHSRQPDTITSRMEAGRAMQSPTAVAEAAAPIIRFDGVTKRFGALTVLDDFSFTVAPGEKVTLIGPSGSGKSTVLRILMTLEPFQDNRRIGLGAADPSFRSPMSIAAHRSPLRDLALPIGAMRNSNQRGLPSTGTIGFGMFFVSGLTRVPWPAARIIPFAIPASSFP